MAKMNPKSLVTTSVVRRALATLAFALVGVLGLGAATVGPAQAAQAVVNTIAGNPSPQPGCFINGAPAKDWHYDVKLKKCVKNAPPKATTPSQTCKTEGNVTTCVSNPYVMIGSKKVAASDMASGRIWIGSDVRLKGTQQNSPRCFWTKGGFTNSMTVNGQLKYYWDPIPAKLCPNPNSPTKWVKVAGGTTGRDCDNPAKAGKMPGLLKGTIINVRSTVNVWLPLNAKVSVVIDDRANGCYASASASALARIRLNVFVRARGNVSVNIFANMFAELKTKANASTDCKPATTTPGPTTTVVVTTPGPTTTTTTTTTTPGTTTTTPQPPAVRRCTISAHAEKTDPYTAYVTVDTEGTGTPNSTFAWGDGTSSGGTTSGIHTYPKPAAGPAGSGVTYTITVSAVFADGQSRSCGSRTFFVPAPPPNGNTGPPPPPGG